MVLHFPGKPFVLIRSLGELKNTSVLNDIQSSVFWLDVQGGDLHLLNLLGKVCGSKPHFLLLYLSKRTELIVALDRSLESIR